MNTSRLKSNALDKSAAHDTSMLNTSNLLLHDSGDGSEEELDMTMAV